MATPPQVNRRALATAAALSALPLLLVLDTATAWLGGWRFRNATPILVAAIALALGTAPITALAFPAGRRWLARHSPRLLLALAALVVAWTAAELTALALLGTRLWFHHHPPDLRKELHPKDHILQGVTGSSRVTFNSLGIRGRELPADRAVRRILCVGGSTTLCLYLDDTETWPALLERELEGGGLPAWVGNLGHNGYSTRHHVLFTRWSDLLAEVDDVVFLIGVNDFMKALLGGSLAGAGGRMPFWLRSPLVTAVQNAYQAHRTADALREDDSGGSYVVRRELRQSSRFVDASPDLGRCIDEYRQNVLDMAAHVRAAGARPVFLANPVRWRHDATDEDVDLWFGQVGEGEVLSTSALRAGMERFEQTLRDTCAELGLAFVDLSSLHGDPELMFDDCHFTEEGARRVAATLAEWFLREPQKARER